VKPANGAVTPIHRAETLAALPALLDLVRQAVMANVGPDDEEGRELKNLLDACVVGAHRLRLREQLRLEEAAGCP
jgi:hypothetical protein